MTGKRWKVEGKTAMDLYVMLDPPASSLRVRSSSDGPGRPREAWQPITRIGNLGFLMRACRLDFYSNIFFYCFFSFTTCKTQTFIGTCFKFLFCCILGFGTFCILPACSPIFRLATCFFRNISNSIQLLESKDVVILNTTFAFLSVLQNITYYLSFLYSNITLLFCIKGWSKTKA